MEVEAEEAFKHKMDKVGLRLIAKGFKCQAERFALLFFGGGESLVSERAVLWSEL